MVPSTNFLISNAQISWAPSYWIDPCAWELQLRAAVGYPFTNSPARANRYSYSHTVAYADSDGHPFTNGPASAERCHYSHANSRYGAANAYPHARTASYADISSYCDANSYAYTDPDTGSPRL